MVLKQVINQFCLPEFCRVYADSDFVCIVSLSGICFYLSSCSTVFFNVRNSLCLVVLTVLFFVVSDCFGLNLVPIKCFGSIPIYITFSFNKTIPKVALSGSYGSWIYNCLCNQNPTHGEMYSVQLYVIRFVSSLVFFSPALIKLTATIQLKYC